MAPRFYSLVDVAEMLNVTEGQVRRLVNSGDLPAIQIGGRGIWRVEHSELEAYIQRMYAQTKARVDARSLGLDDDTAVDADA